MPKGARSYRIKWGGKKIVDWIGFDPKTNAFIGNPNDTMAWFAAENVPTLPEPAAEGTRQSLDIDTGKSGLSAAHFSVKAYVDAAGRSD